MQRIQTKIVGVFVVMGKRNEVDMQDFTPLIFCELSIISFRLKGTTMG